MSDYTGYKEKTGGHFDGCTFFRWENWEWAVPVYLIVLFTAVGIAVGFSMKGMPRVGLLVYALVYTFGVSLVRDFCGAGAGAEGEFASGVFTFVLAGFLLAGSFLQFPAKENAMKPGGSLSWLLFRKLGVRKEGALYEQNFLGIAPLNEFLEMSVIEWFYFGLVMAWLATAAYWRYEDVMSESAPVGIEYSLGNKTRAVGRAFAAMAVRCIFLSMASASRNVMMFQLLNVPFERAMKFHEMIGRFQVMIMYCHVICMITGGIERDGVAFDDKFSLVRGINIFPGWLALIFWTCVVVGSLDYFRRKYWDAFYFMHIQFFFMANIMTVFHNRQGAAVWVASAIGLFYIDAGLRAIAKLKTVVVKEISLVEDNMDKGGASIIKLVINQDGYPVAPNKHHPGSYVWLSIGGRRGPMTEKSMELTLVGDNKPGSVAVSEESAEAKEAGAGEDEPLIPPSLQMVPSFIWFHAVTISSYNPETKDITLFIKAQAGSDDEWAGHLVRLARDVKGGKLAIDQFKMHVGGPHGSLQVDPDETDHMVLVAGGIGVTPMAAVLEDRLRALRSKEDAWKGTLAFVWSSRSYDEMAAFTYLLRQVGEFQDKVKVMLHYTGKAQEKDAEAGGALAELKALPNLIITEGRFDFTSDGILPVDKANRVGVYVCGPKLISHAAEAFCYAKRADGYDTYFHRETFDL